MRQNCPECGEELIGAVNRCWNCGTALAVEQTLIEPPIRRAPVDLSPRPPNRLVHSKDGQAFWGFCRHLSALGVGRCAIASLVISAIGCVVGLGTAWAALLGLIGIGLGVIGMPSDRQDVATLGLVLGVIALFLGFGQLGYDIWVHYSSRQLINIR